MAEPRAGPAVSRQKFPAVRRGSAGGRTPRPGLTRALWRPHPRGCRCPSPLGTPGLKGWGLGFVPFTLFQFPGKLRSSMPALHCKHLQGTPGAGIPGHPHTAPVSELPLQGSCKRR